MKNRTKLAAAVFCSLFAFFRLPSVSVLASGAANAAVKDGNASVFYGAVFIVSLVLFFVYLLCGKRRDAKFLWLYGCIVVANLGYFLLSTAKTLEWALWANRIGYLGSAFAVLAMLIIVADVCQLKLSRFHRILLFSVSAAAFLFASTGGWLDIYYSQVSFEIVNGVGKLVKSYAPLHLLYTVYVLAYFAIMVAIIVFARRKGNLSSAKYAIFLAAVVLCNIAVWAVEQLIQIDFEFLSISYVATGIFMLLMRFVIQDYTELREKESAFRSAPADSSLPPDIELLFSSFSARVTTLTPSERMILQYIIDGYSLEEAADSLFISVNTARKHNTNLKRKLELSSREELSLYIDLFRRAGRLDEITYMQ